LSVVSFSTQRGPYIGDNAIESTDVTTPSCHVFIGNSLIPSYGSILQQLMLNYLMLSLYRHKIGNYVRI